MADSEPLLQPEMLAELEQYRALVRRVQVSRQQSQEFNELAKQVAPGNILPLSTPLRDGSPVAELDATLAALRQQIRTIHQIEAKLNELQIHELQRDLSRPMDSSQSSPLSQPRWPLVRGNMKIALYVIGGIVLCVLLLMLLYAVSR